MGFVSFVLSVVVGIGFSRGKSEYDTSCRAGVAPPSGVNERWLFRSFSGLSLRFSSEKRPSFRGDGAFSKGKSIWVPDCVASFCACATHFFCLRGTFQNPL